MWTWGNMCIFICMTISLKFTDLIQNITVKDLRAIYFILHINAFELSCNIVLFSRIKKNAKHSWEDKNWPEIVFIAAASTRLPKAAESAALCPTAEFSLPLPRRLPGLCSAFNSSSSSSHFTELTTWNQESIKDVNIVLITARILAICMKWWTTDY